jgi:BASS family bile acid:Na+ symporter
LTEKIEKPIRWLSMAIFIGFVVFAVVGNWDNIKNYIHLVFLLVFLHNGLAFLVGYGFSRLNRLPEKDARAISIETGIQNTGLGLVLVFNFFDGIGGMALVMACWGVWHLISGFALAMWWSRNAKG